MSTTNETFDGLAFPVAKVRYTGNGYSASIYRDRDITYRARTSYDHAIGGGARGALPAALKAFDKALADNNGIASSGEYVAIPGDFTAELYVFTFVPKHFFMGAERTVVTAERERLIARIHELADGREYPNDTASTGARWVADVLTIEGSS